MGNISYRLDALAEEQTLCSAFILFAMPAVEILFWDKYYRYLFGGFEAVNCARRVKAAAVGLL